MGQADSLAEQAGLTLKRKIFTSVLILLALSYPLYEAIDVALSDGLSGHCISNTYRPSGTGIGAFCSWGLSLGGVLFGPDKAHLGYSLLLAGTAFGFGVFAFWVTGGKPEKQK